MASDTLIYHPPKKEPSFFNEHTISGLLAGTMCALFFTGSLPLILTLGATCGLIAGYGGKKAEETQQTAGIIAKKPTGIMNGAMVIGGLIFGLFGLTLAPLAFGVAETGAALAFTAASATFGGLLYGAVANKNRENTYNMAVQQQAEREGITHLVEQVKTASIYKDIKDLEQTREQGTHHQDAELVREKQQIYEQGASRG